MTLATVLLVGHPSQLDRWVGLLGADVAVRRVETVRQAFEALGEGGINAVLCGWGLPDGGGAAVAEYARSLGLRDTVVFVSGVPDGERGAAFEAGADDIVGDAPEAIELQARVRRRLELQRQLRTMAEDNQRLTTLSVTDGLTQVFNHRAFKERLHDEFRRAQRYDDPLGLIMLDIDHFKRVNDGFGHQAGDEVLKAVAGAIREAVRETDLVARYGGEEFGVLLPKTNLSGALTVAERVGINVKRVRVPATPGHSITGSIGVSCFPSRTVATAEQLVKTADEALGRAKNDGRNRITIYQSPWPAARA